MTLMKYALLSYSTYNLGDEIQSIAAQDFLPRIDAFIDRDHNARNQAYDPTTKLIMNGWFTHYPEHWPPGGSVDSLLISVHLTVDPGWRTGVSIRDIVSSSRDLRSFLSKSGPVGARDRSTEQFLCDLGIDSYFSGCLTLSLKRPDFSRDEGLTIYCDVPIMPGLPIRRDGLQIARTTHLDMETVGREARFAKASSLINLYARAKCVVTTRLHCALPCLAMGTPVLLLDGGTDPRLSGLRELLHWTTFDDFVSGKSGYDINDPPPNKTDFHPLRETMATKVRAFLSDAETKLPK